MMSSTTAAAAAAAAASKRKDPFPALDFDDADLKQSATAVVSPTEAADAFFFFLPT